METGLVKNIDYFFCNVPFLSYTHHIAGTNMHRKQYLIMLIMLYAIPYHALSANTSLSLEATMPGYSALVAGYEHEDIRLEAGVFFLPTQIGIYKAQLTGPFLMQKNFSLYGGFGMLLYPDASYTNFTLGAGVAFECAWKVPRHRSWEFKIGLLLPLLFYDTYEMKTDDDFFAPGDFDRLVLILIAPTIGIRYTF